MRLFIAIRPPGEIRDVIAGAARDWLGHSRAVRRVPSHNLHLTLAFLGEVDDGRLPDVDQSLRRSVDGIVPIRMWLGHWGRFPPRGRPRVYWLGVEADESLGMLADRVREILVPFQRNLDRKRFSPHMTVARMRHGSGGPVSAEADPPPSGAWTASEVVLVRSRLGSGPARYTTLERYPLAGDPAEPAVESTPGPGLSG